MQEKDKKILEAVKQNARSSTREIAKKTRLPITTVYNRLKRLEKEKVILGYTANIDYEKCGKPVSAFLFLTVDYEKIKHLTQAKMKEKIIKTIHPEEAHMVTGNFDIMLKIHAESTKHLSETIEALRKVEGVDKTHTMVVIE